MSGRMGSGAGRILEGIKRRSPRDGTAKDSQVDVKNVEPLSVEVKREEIKPAEEKRDEVILDAHHNVNVHNTISDEHINVNVLQEAVDIALNKKQRISVWAPDIALIMWYLKLTKPMFGVHP